MMEYQKKLAAENEEMQIMVVTTILLYSQVLIVWIF